MSIPATNYALEVLEQCDPGDLPTGARLVLLALAARANVRTAETYSGRWLVPVTGMRSTSVRRSIAQLEALGLVAVDRRDGRASVVRFPLTPYIGAITDEITDVRSYPQPAPRGAGIDPGTDVRGAPVGAPPVPEGSPTRPRGERVSVPLSVSVSAPVVDVLERFPRSGAHGIAILEEARNEQVAAQ